MKIKIAIYGTGRAGLGFLKFLQESGYAVSGLITSSRERAEGIEQETGVPGFVSLDELLEAVPDTTVALIANANDRHKEATIESLARGLHVYCEKPMAPTLEESRAMLEAEQASEGSLQIGFEYIHSLMPRRVRELRDEGFFGQVLTAGCLDSRGHWWAGKPDAPFEKQVKLRREVGGGIVFHCGIHQLDMLRAYLGEFEEVQAYRSASNALPYYPEDVPDHVQIMLRGAGGKLGSLEIFHNRAPTYYRSPLPEGRAYHELPGHEFRLSLTGSGGSCLADFYGAKLHLFKFDHERKETQLIGTEDFSDHPQNDLHHDMNGMLLRYLKRIERGEGPLTPAADAYKTMELATAVETSIAEKRAVRLSQS
ncbi:MAG: Gfo/Idh/MocA family protein [Opitutales bacterium]